MEFEQIRTFASKDEFPQPHSYTCMSYIIFFMLVGNLEPVVFKFSVFAKKICLKYMFIGNEILRKIINFKDNDRQYQNM